MIGWQDVTVRYPEAGRPTLAGTNLEIPEGDLCLVVGPTGSGKSTLLGTINGLVPHFTGGTLEGRVTVAGRDTARHRPRELADLVGYVGRIRCAASSPTPSRTKSPTAWNSSGSNRSRCANGSRRRST